MLGVLREQLPREPHDLRDARIRELIVDRAVLATSGDEATPTKAREVVGNLGLRDTERCHQLAHRELAVAEQLQHTQPRRVTESAKVLGEQILLAGSLRQPERGGLEQCSGHGLAVYMYEF